MTKTRRMKPLQIVERISFSFSSAEGKCSFDSFPLVVAKRSYVNVLVKKKSFGGDHHLSTRSQPKNSCVPKPVVSCQRAEHMWTCKVILVLGLLLSFAIGSYADVTTTTWSTSMTQHHTRGSFNITTTDSGTSSAEMQLTSISYGSTSNSIYMAESPQSTTGGGFTLSYEIKVDSSSVADSIFAFIGTSSIPSQEDTTTAGNGMIIAFIVYQFATSGRGIYLRKTTSSSYSTVATYTSGVTASGNWETITITYTPSSTNTWKVGRSVYFAFIVCFCLFLSIYVCPSVCLPLSPRLIWLEFSALHQLFLLLIYSFFYRTVRCLIFYIHT